MNAAVGGGSDGSWGSPGPRGVLENRVSERTRSGCCNAMARATAPPIDTPARWTGSAPSASSRPTASRTRSSNPYVGRPAGHDVDSPVSRLSYRITWRPPAASIAQKCGCQASIGLEVPPISSNDGSVASPKESAHSTTSFTGTRRLPSGAGAVWSIPALWHGLRVDVVTFGDQAQEGCGPVGDRVLTRPARQVDQRPEVSVRRQLQCVGLAVTPTFAPGVRVRPQVPRVLVEPEQVAQVGVGVARMCGMTAHGERQVRACPP